MELKLKHKIFLISFSIIIILTIEGIARLIYKPSRLDKILTILEPHKERIWRGRPFYTGDFFGASVKHNSLGMRAIEPQDSSILVLGGSPSYGWGVPFNKTYSALLDKSLSHYKVVNGSMVGYSSYQGKLLLQEIFPLYRPKVVTISYVINDVDHYRFFNNTPESDEDVLKRVSSYSWLNDFYLLKIMNEFFSKLPRPNNTRVNSNNYKQNLLEMIQYIRGQGSKVLLIKFPVNLPHKLSDQELNKLVPTECNIRKMTTRELYDCIGNKLSDNDLRKLLAVNSSLRAKEYNLILESLGKELNIPVADAVHAFNSKSDYLFIDKHLDPIHPNEKGHHVLFETIKPLIEKML